MKHHSLRRCALTVAMLAGLAGAAGAQAVQDIIYRYQYDAQGNLTQITDPLGQVTNQSYDALNRLKQQLQPAPAAGAARPAINSGYDGLDQLIRITDPRNLATTYTIDGLGNRTALASPDTGNAGSTYDAAGNLLTHTDAKGQTTAYTYDVLNRVKQITYADGNTVAYAYDQGPNAIGRLTQITDVSGTTRYAYDPKGRIVTDTRTMGNVSYVIAYAYDSAGRLASVTYPSGRLVSYTRDAAGRIGRIDVTKDGASQTIASQIVYRPFAGVQSFVNGAGQTIHRTFDLAGRITSYSLRGQPQLINYDAASRIAFVWDTADVAKVYNYGYDNLDRLTQFSGAGANQSFGYDPVGNRTSQIIGGGSYGYSYSPGANRLVQVNSPGASQAYAYDANGSLLHNGANQFTYDARGRLVAANTVLGLVQYRINALGQRMQKVTPTETTVFHYDNSGKLIGESNGQSSTEYVYLEDMPVAVLK